MTDKYDKLLKKYDLSPDDLEHVLKQLKTPKKNINNTYKYDSKSNHIRLGVFSDTHYGHNKFRYDVHKASVKVFNKKNIDMILHCGDIIEGMSNRDGHIYELDKIGVTAQLKEAVTLLSEYNKDLYFILGNHDAWSKNKSNQGFNIGKYLEDNINGSKYLGDLKADIELSDNVKIRLSHEGNSAYALSYSSQKRINAMEGGSKPNILFNGHLHKSMYMFYRNIHAFEVGCLLDQTEFMAMKGSPAMVGFWVVDLFYNNNGINKIKPEFYPFY